LLFSVWTAKGGAGATTVALGLATSLARRNGVLLVDLGGDLPAAFGVADPALGLTDWLATDDGDSEALGRLETEIDDRISLLSIGHARTWEPHRDALLVNLLGADDRLVVIDVGCLDREPTNDVARLRLNLVMGGEVSLLVLRPNYLALRRAHGLGVTPTGVVLVEESARSMSAAEVSELIGAPVLARVGIDDAITRVIDAGMTRRRLPRPFTKALSGVA